MSDQFPDVGKVIRGYESMVDQVLSATVPNRPRRVPPVGPSPKEMRSILRDVIEAWTARIFVILATGTHSSGDSNAAIWAKLEASGRDFLAITREMKADIKARLSHEFLHSDVIPLALDFEQEFVEAVRERVRARLNGTIRDVRIRANSPGYRIAKRAAGYVGGVGVRTGHLLRSVARLRVILK